MNNFPKVFFVVVNHNGKKTLAKCLKSIYQSAYANYEVVLVDNASTDGSLEETKQLFSRAHFIKNTQNLGFAKANNLGIRYALEKFADFVFLLNNDAYLAKDTLQKMLAALPEDKLSLANPLIYKNSSKQIWFAGGKIDWLHMKTQHLFAAKSSQPYLSEYLTGCALLINKAVFKQVGLLDEAFFLYYEDADFSLRAQKAGFALNIIPTAKVWHDEQSETNNPHKLYWLVFSALLFFRKHTSFFQKFYLWPYLGLRKLKNFFSLLQKDNALAKQVRKAYQDFANHRA